VPEVDPAARARAGFYSVTKSDMQQSWVVMGALGGKRNDPDFYALQVMNEVLGGGFGSRLFSNVRSEQGLAYAVFSDWSAEWDHPGTLFVGGSSKPQTTVKLYQSMLKEVERMAQGGVTADELARAKDAILKGFAFEFDNTNKVISRLMNYEFYGYPPDYLQQYHARINKVTQEDVARVAKQYLKPGELAVLFVGNGSYEAPLTSLGPVQTIDVTIPEPKQKELAAATPESIAKGKRLLSASLAATGGKAVLAVKDESVVGEATIETPQGSMSLKIEATINLAGRMLQRMQAPMGEMTTGFDGQTAWMSAGGQTQELPGSQKGEFEGALRRDTVALLQRLDDPSLTIQSLRPTTLDGKQAEVVAISDPASGLQTKVFIDPTTHLIVAKQFVAAIMGPPTETEELYSDYREVGGVKIPFKSVTRQAGKTRVQLTASEVKINPGVPESAYKKP
jgi:zinc protease